MRLGYMATAAVMMFGAVSPATGARLLTGSFSGSAGETKSLVAYVGDYSRFLFRSSVPSASIFIASGYEVSYDNYACLNRGCSEYKFDNGNDVTAGGGVVTSAPGAQIVSVQGENPFRYRFGFPTGSPFGDRYEAYIRGGEVYVDYTFAPGLFNQTVNYTLDAFRVVPEPATWAMLLSGVGVAGGALRRRRAKVKTTVSFA